MPSRDRHFDTRECRPRDRHAAPRGVVARTDPQGFHFDVILAAHRAAAKEARAAFTDDAGIAEWYGLDVALVEGSEGNRKLTSAEDIASADELLKLRAQRALGVQRVATGYDVHAFGPGDAVILCGVLIPHERRSSATAMPMSACMRSPTLCLAQ